MSRLVPRGILLDLDDTILDDTGGVIPCWQAACSEAAALHSEIESSMLLETILRHRSQFWADAKRHRVGRQNPHEASRAIVRSALQELGCDTPDLAIRVADRFRHLREERRTVIPGAIDALKRLRVQGSRLALITQGSAEGQRRKIERFDLARYFDRVWIEGELGFGKPDERVYRDPLSALECHLHEAWSIGDHLEWDVAAPQRLGVYGVWVDVHGTGLPANSPTRPHRIIRSIAELP